MSQYTSYWLYQKYEKRGDQDWIPTYPNEYSVDANGTLTPVIKLDNDTACGYSPTPTTQYRWVNMNPLTDYYCEECPVDPSVKIYRWAKAPVSDYVCDTTTHTKYYKEYYQYSTDGGITWQNVVPGQTRTSSTVIEYNSTDCGYVPPVEKIYRWVKTNETTCVYAPDPSEIKYYGIYKNDEAYSIDCDDDPTLHVYETLNLDTSKDLLEVIVGNCVTIIGDCEIKNREVNGNFSISTSLTAVTIPSGVTCIGNSAFYGCENLPSVKLPSELTFLGEYAFNKCYSLTSVGKVNSNSSIEIPPGVSAINWSTFEECFGLTTVTIPETVKTIYSMAFWGCTGVTSLTIENGVKKIYYDAFSYCNGINSVYIPASVNYIEHKSDSFVQGTCVNFNEGVINYGLSMHPGGIFGDCKNLTSITVDNSNTVYDSRDNCNGIVETSTNSLIAACKNTVIPNTVTTIYKEAFKLCTSLTSIVIPDNVISIDEDSFDGCISLTSVTIGSGVTYIKEYTFANCKKLPNIDIPDNVTGIANRAFHCCPSLTGITIGNSANIRIYDNPFEDCTNIESIVVDSNNPYMDSRDNCNAIIKTPTEYGFNDWGVTLMIGCKNTIIPNSVKTIRNGAFINCSGLTYINIPYSVNWIGAGAFEYCDSLSSVTIGNGVTKIDSNAFDYCNNLETVTILATTPPKIGYSVFPQYIQSKLRAIIVPRGRSNIYKISPGWKEYESIIYEI